MSTNEIKEIEGFQIQIIAGEYVTDSTICSLDNPEEELTHIYPRYVQNIEISLTSTGPHNIGALKEIISQIKDSVLVIMNQNIVDTCLKKSK